MRKSAETTLRILWCILIFALPFRWNFAVASMEQPFLPESTWEWVFTNLQPHFSLSLIAGVLFLLTLALYPTAPKKHASLWVPLLTFSPLLFGLAGLVHTTECTYAQNWYYHFYTIACTATGLWWTSRHDEKLLPWAFHAIAIGALISAIEGWTQHFGGLQREFEEQLAFMKETGQQLSEQMIAKFQQTRARGCYGDPNAYAAQLLVSCPFLILDALRLAKRCNTPKTAAWLLGGATAILAAGALIFSGSRGAVLGAMAGLFLAMVFQYGRRLSKTWKCALIAACVLGAIGMVLMLNKFSQRKMETVTIRMEYYTTACKIYQQYPIFGAGLGEFFPWHLRLRPWEGDEARDPHSLFFAQLSQCGIPGALDAFLRLVAPLLLALGLFRKSRVKAPLQAATILGAWCAWNAHALTQFNDQIVSTATMVGFLGLFFFENEAEQTAPASTRNYTPVILAVLLALGCFWELHTIPAVNALQTADTARTDRYASYSTKKSLLQEACRRNSQNPYAPRMLLDIALSHDDRATAEEAYTLLLKVAPHRSSTYLRHWRLDFGNPEAEQKALADLSAWNPTDMTWWLLKALDERCPNLPSVVRKRLASYPLEKHEVTDQEIHIGIALNNTFFALQDEAYLAPLLKEGYPETLSHRNIVFGIDK